MADPVDVAVAVQDDGAGTHRARPGPNQLPLISTVPIWVASMLSSHGCSTTWWCSAISERVRTPT